MPERTDHNEAMRLADRISPETDWYEFDQVTWCNEAAALLRQQAERELALMAERDQHQATATALIALLADIRKACGDNGKRMQPELVEFIGAMSTERDQLRADAERYQWLREHSYVEVTCKSPRDPSWTPQQLDAAIDAARTTHKETE